MTFHDYDADTVCYLCVTQEDEVENNPEVAVLMARIHRYACLRRDINPDARGSRLAIAKALGVSRNLYMNLLRGRTSVARARAVAQQLEVDPEDPSPLWLEFRQLLEDMEAAGLDMTAARAALP